MTRAEWVRRCAAQFVRLGIAAEAAKAEAVTSYEVDWLCNETGRDEVYSPERIALDHFHLIGA